MYFISVVIYVWGCLCLLRSLLSLFHQVFRSFVISLFRYMASLFRASVLSSLRYFVRYVVMYLFMCLYLFNY